MERQTVERTIPITTYYTARGTLEKRFREKGRQDAFRAKSAAEFEDWKRDLRKTLRGLLGLDNMSPCPERAEVTERITLPSGIVRERVVIDVEEGISMPVYVLIPPAVNDVPVQCVICAPGHMGAGKYSVAGRRDIPAVAEAIDRFNYDYGMKAAELGFVAFCPDCRGFGERREEALQNDSESAFLNSTCFHLAHMAEPLGQTVAGQLTWDLMRLADYIQSRGEWRSEKIGCIGFSGGGMQTLWFSAMDDRVGFSVISGYMYGYLDSLLKLNGNCSCNYVPNLWLHADMGDIGALLAPRPVMIQSCREDNLAGERGLANVYEQVEIMRQAYRLFGAEGNILHDIREGGHCFHPEPLGAFLPEAASLQT